MDINTEFSTLADEALASYAAEVRAASLAAVEALSEDSTDEQIAEAEALANHLDAVVALQGERTEAATARADRAAALRQRFSEQEPEPEPEEEEEEEPQVEEQTQPEPVASTDPPSPEAKAKGVAALSKKVARPKIAKKAPVVITAAADVPDFSTGQALSDMDEVGKALVARMRGFGTPTGDGSMENLQHYGVAKFGLNFPEELTIKPHADDMAVLSYAAQESRLEGGTLTAAGGWCAPSETMYDLCTTGESLDGILSIAEVNVARGGIKYTSGPDFSDIYTSVGFMQTEAQAIAGTAKACFEVPCPAFEEVRLDAIGLCIKAPILTNAAYPELVRRWLTGSMVAHAHKVNAQVLSRIATASGTAIAVDDFGGTSQSTLAALELRADRLRQAYKMGLDETLEVVVPFWVRSAIRSDLSLRTGAGYDAVTDSVISAHFAARHLNVQFVYDWQELPAFTVSDGYPATFEALIYPAGTFVKGTSDVITLNAVYDAASLATNVYTALFFEQGLLVARMCAEANRVTIPVCNAGRTGIANVAECGIGANV